MKKVCMAALLGGASVGALLAQPALAQGQTTSPQTQDEESVASSAIVVTARKRSETLLETPVVITAVAADTLKNQGIVSLDGIAQIVPQLIIAPQGGSVQGGNLSIRGIAGPDSNPFGDQAVSFVVDGVQIAKATVRRLADTDISQVEVMKGPQALFYGKNSPAGVVSIRTNDPGPRFEAGGTLGYETEAREMRAEGFVSVPVNDTLGVRFAGIYSTMEGYLRDISVDDPVAGEFRGSHRRSPDNQTFNLRGTALWEPASNFTARLKVNYGEVDQNGPAATTEFTHCANGQRFSSFIVPNQSAGQCSPGKQTVNAGYGPLLSTLGGTLNYFRADGANFQNQSQLLSGLELSWDVADHINITSVTGLFNTDLTQCQNYENDYIIMLPSCNRYKNKEFSQELRFNTDFGGMIDFAGGAYFSDTKATSGSYTFLMANGFGLLAAPPPAGFGIPDFGSATFPAQVNEYLLKQHGNAYSAYGQVIFRPIDTIEIAVGGRYTREDKELTDVRSGSGISEGVVPDFILPAGTSPGGYFSDLNDPRAIVPLALTKASYKDFSPEVTVSFRPSRNVNLFASYKEGFLAGGFNSSSVAFNIPNASGVLIQDPDLDLSFRPQRVNGFETGVKLSLLGGDLGFNAAAYTYKIEDLQVVNFTNATSTIRNAGAAKVKGVEIDFSYRTPLEGLSLHGAAAYNDAKYTSFPGAPCYNGQTPAEGCNIIDGNPTQDLNGQVLPRAPKWNLSGGMDFKTDVTSDLVLGLNANVVYSSSYLTDATNSPYGRQGDYALLGTSIRLGSHDERWQVSVIGRNLTNKFIYAASTDVPFSGSGTGTAAGQLGDRFASVSRGREILMQVRFHFR